MAVDAYLPPAITLTNPQNEDQLPSPALSPLTPLAHNGANARSIARWTTKANVPARPASRASDGMDSTWSGVDAPRSESVSSSRASPTKLRKPRSNNASPSISAGAMIAAHDLQFTEIGTSDVQPHAIDPLSSHIIKRTSASPLVTSRNRRLSITDPTSMHRGSDVRSARSPSPSVKRRETAEHAHKDLRTGVKAVSFLSRIMGNSRRKEADEQTLDTESLASDAQLEGNEAEVFARSLDSGVFSARHPQSPGYVKVRSKYKEKREFERLFLAQELFCSKRRKIVRTDSNKLRRKSSGGDPDTVWAMEFSKDGMYLAAAGADTIVRVWKVLSSPEDRRSQEKQESSDIATSYTNNEHLNAPVFQSQPVREYEGHEAAVLDLSWSKNNFLLSSSMDKTVRLWHVTRAECLCTFKHTDFVPSIAFHPKDDRFFLAGSLDSKLRLWSIPDKNVAFATSAPDMITAVAFMPDGKSAVAGTLGGSCIWYETEGLKYKTKLQVRPDRGQSGRGPKITGIQTAHGRGSEKLLVTSNDSKIRLYNPRDKSCEVIFKGNENNSSQIRGSLSDDGRYVVCGSEDRRAYMWSTAPTSDSKVDRRPLEYFDAHDTVTTAVRMAPNKTKQLLSRSDDPGFESYNPVSNVGAKRASRAESVSSSKAPTEPGNGFNTPRDPESRFARRKESSSSMAWPAHGNGHIIVTADLSGKIKVFRQDSVSSQRQKDDVDSASLLRRGKRSSFAASLMTKNSQHSLRDARNAAIVQAAGSDRDRIISWRQGISSTPNLLRDGSPQLQHQLQQQQQQPQPQNRNESSPKISQASQSETQTRSDTNTSPSLRSTIPTSTESADRPAIDVDDSTPKPRDILQKDNVQQRDVQNPLFLDGQRSYMFWNKDEWQDRAKRAQAMFEQHTSVGASNDTQLGEMGMRPIINREKSVVSQLSDERSRGASDGALTDDDNDDDNEHFDDAPEQPGNSQPR